MTTRRVNACIHSSQRVRQHTNRSFFSSRRSCARSPRRTNVVICMAVTRVMISGAPASGKGTQCEMLSEKLGLTHISAGDLLRAEVANGTENGKTAKEYMDAGKLVPNDIIITMIKDRLAQPDAQAGWLLDGYPRSKDQADALEEADIRPEVFLLLEVPEDILVERVVGRRLDPETGKIYHLKYNKPENAEIEARLTQRSDDTEEKVVPRLATHNSNVAAILDSYENVLVRINGDQHKDQVYADIDKALSAV